MTPEELKFHRIGQHIRDAEKGYLFGKPCYKNNGKAFICFFKRAMVFKLTGKQHQNALELEGATLFDPSGKRPMKDWVQVPAEHIDYWPNLAQAAWNALDTTRW